MEYLKLFLTGFLQVFLVAINVWQIANDKYIGVLLIGFTISFVWSYSVKKIAFGTLKHRLFYSIGAGIGGLIGLILCKIIY